MDKALSHDCAESDQVMKAHESADMNEKSVQESRLLGHFSKCDVRYWQRAIFHQTYTRNGETLLTAPGHFSMAAERCGSVPAIETSTSRPLPHAV